MLIKALRGEIQIPWEIQTLVEDYLSSYIQVFVQYIFRKGNQAIDWLANLAFLLLHLFCGSLFLVSHSFYPHRGQHM